MLPVEGYPIHFTYVINFTIMLFAMLRVEGYPIHFENVTIFHSYVIANVACGRLSYPLYVRYQFHRTLCDYKCCEWKVMISTLTTLPFFSYVITNVACGRLSYPLYVRYQFHSYVITNVASGRLFYPL